MSTHANHLRILHTSDWQLGMSPSFLGEEARPRYTYDRLVAVKRVLAEAEAQQCDAVVVAGDVFDNNFLKPEVYQRALDILEDAELPVFLLPGNHDPLDAASIYRTDGIQQLKNVTVLVDSTPIQLERLGEGAARIVGAPMRSRHVNVDLVGQALDTLTAPQDSTITVLVGHGAAIAFGTPEPEHIDIARAEEAYRRRVVDYIALGDTHSAMQLDQDGVIWYSGSPEVTDYRESDGGGESNSGKALIVDITVEDPSHPADVAVREITIGQWAFQALSAEVNNRQDAERFIETLKALPNKAQTSVKYSLSGVVDVDTYAWLDSMAEQTAPKFAALYRRTRTWSLYTRPSDEELSGEAFGDGIAGTVAHRLAELIDAGDTRASDALNLLYKLSQEMKVTER
ncbi:MULTISPECIES: DNA repair exonuclease [Corynebacterium]|uniref:metallophosphoesterase family protein n=1 Tax=Corynebacterium TaxID=1716 RepID=UPI001CE44B9D|nr:MULTISPECIES: DNA repair exonuclease [Corynebacterium]